MKKILIAFDVDGTLIQKNDSLSAIGKWNKRIRALLVILSSFKNVKIMVWSGGGKEYARRVARKLRITKHVNVYGDKNYQGSINSKHIFTPDIKPDIAIDDIHDCSLGIINLIVHEK